MMSQFRVEGLINRSYAEGVTAYGVRNGLSMTQAFLRYFSMMQLLERSETSEWTLMVPINFSSSFNLIGADDTTQVKLGVNINEAPEAMLKRAMQRLETDEPIVALRWILERSHPLIDAFERKQPPLMVNKKFEIKILESPW